MLRVPVSDGVDGELVVGPARVLDTVAGAARLVPHLHLRVQRQVLRTKYFYEKCEYFLDVCTASKQTPVVLQSSVMPLP